MRITIFWRFRNSKNAPPSVPKPRTAMPTPKQPCLPSSPLTRFPKTQTTARDVYLRGEPSPKAEQLQTPNGRRTTHQDGPGRTAHRAPHRTAPPAALVWGRLGKALVWATSGSPAPLTLRPVSRCGARAGGWGAAVLPTGRRGAEWFRKLDPQLFHRSLVFFCTRA